jgi:hypothetical protein
MSVMPAITDALHALLVARAARRSAAVVAEKECGTMILFNAAVCLLLFVLALLDPVEAQQPPTIEKLLTDRWEIAGYIAIGSNRSLILFKKGDVKYLVQCSVLIDVTRDQRVVTTCYELK